AGAGSAAARPSRRPRRVTPSWLLKTTCTPTSSTTSSRVPTDAAMTDPREPMRQSMQWVWRGTALGALLGGWVFIGWQNHFHITAPLVVVCLAYLAVVATVYNLWRTGVAAVATGDDEPDSTWVKSTGALGELEREKRTLLKAIKEAEFDHQM